MCWKSQNPGISGNALFVPQEGYNNKITVKLIISGQNIRSGIKKSKN
jgi:hypothetical protein